MTQDGAGREQTAFPGIMSDSTRIALLEQPNIAVFGTSDADGKPALAPVWYLWRDGEALIAMDGSSRKGRNLQRDPRATLCIDTRQPPYSAVIIEGRAELTADIDYRATVRELAIHYLGQEAGEAYAAREPAGSTAVLVRLRPDRTISWAY